MNDEVSRIRRRYEREKAARKEAEQLLESKSLELFNTNQQLRYLAESLEKQVQQRTQELVSARDQALSSARAKSSFLANMSHEIRTPINGVLGMVKLLSDTELNSRQRKLLDTARTSGELLLLVINDILDFTKLEANKLSLETIPFNPREVIEQCTETFASQCFDKDIELVCDVKAQMPQLLEGDPTRLQQILHLLRGARHARSRAGPSSPANP